MITLRWERIVILGLIIAVIVFTTWKIDYFGSENLEPPAAANNNNEKDPVAEVETPNTKTPSKVEPLKDSSKEKDPKIQNPPVIGPFTTITDGLHAHGFTLLENLYLREGTLYIVAQDESKFPPLRDMISRPVEMAEGVDLEPTGKELKFLTSKDAADILGKHAIRVEDLSVIVYDPPQFLHHFYHWWGEIILGISRVLSAEGSKTKKTLVPQRFLLPFSTNGAFRDDIRLNAPLTRAAFPHALFEESDYWEDYIELNVTVVFERVMLVNRPAAHRHPMGGRWNKMIASTMSITVPTDFWAPIRQTLVRNTLGYVPEPEKKPEKVHGAEEPTPKPLVTYISRQGSRRFLLAADHKALVEALTALAAEGVCEFYEAKMESLSLTEQIELAARSTIIVGVHGNGLTHELWMPPSHRSAIFEIFYPEGYVFDYELLARNLGHKHYAVWNDKLVTYAEGKYHDGVKYGNPEDFHGTSIPVHAVTVAKAIKERLSTK